VHIGCLSDGMTPDPTSPFRTFVSLRRVLRHVMFFD
jgi:hypothetical protein